MSRWERRSIHAMAGTDAPGSTPTSEHDVTVIEGAETAKDKRRAFIRQVTNEAKAYWESGRTFYVVKLDLGASTAGWMSVTGSGGDDVAGALQMIEKIGWRLDSSGYVLQPLRERSSLTDPTLPGRIIGVYTFKRPWESMV
ncbi:MAG: hypothetical protein ACM3OO_06540 [Planctomycetaceae bacterium]